MNFFVNTDDPGLRAQYGNPAFQVVGGPGGQPTQLAQYPGERAGITGRTLAVLILASSAAAGYHGYKRNGNAIAALGWAGFGFFFPVPTIAYAAGQGFAKPE